MLEPQRAHEVENRRKRRPEAVAILLLMSGLLFLWALAGCDSVSRHKALSTVFDGVPTLPPAEEMCADYYEQRVAAEAGGDDPGAEPASVAGVRRSEHRPYVEKKCNDCHSNDKNVNDGLIRPKRELCFACHKDFIRGANVHGPVAVGDCLACHLPHNSVVPSLLKEGRDEICALCHQEERLAAGMHERFLLKGIGCGECHDPHSGDARYFLK